MNINLVRKFAIFIMILFILDGITNIVSYSNYYYLVWGVIQTFTCIIAIILVLRNKA